MAENPEKSVQKSPHALREEKILAFWKEKDIFAKSLAKNKGRGKDFVFYEGPPTANGRPGIHHLEARAFKDAIPRYKTMRGYYVRRKGGWDTHGLPVELQVEKELGLKSKKDIEKYGLEAFNEKCKQSVWTYVHEWEDFTKRMGYWVDLNDPYVTYKPSYMESLWNIVKKVDTDGRLYKDYKVVPWCPRCGTGLSSHELAQGYETVKDLSVYVKFKLKNPEKVGLTSGSSVLAWTTTPWTLPGNVGLAVGAHIDYVELKTEGGSVVIAKDRVGVVSTPHTIGKLLKGSDLVGLEYEPLYPFLKENISGPEKDKLKNAYKIYDADFVTTTDGTGIVHTAVMYGQEDFELGTKVGLPKYHLVNDDGTFKKEAGFLAGKFVKGEGVDVEIIKDLAHKGVLFHKEKYEHTYPFCWRCKTPLIYFARDSWYIRMSELRSKLVSENKHIHWEPGHIKEGRFGEWLKEVKDWAISRERYWGTPLPVWRCEKCEEKRVVGSVAEVSKKPRNTYYVMRHGEAGNNVKGVLNGGDRNLYHLTDKGREQVSQSAASMKGVKIDTIYTSPFARTRETADILKKTCGLIDTQIIVDERLHEVNFGESEGQQHETLKEKFSWTTRFDSMPNGGEKYGDIKRRMGDFLYEIESKNEGKTIVIVTHGTPAMMLFAAALGLDRTQSTKFEIENYIHKSNIRKMDFVIVPHNHEYELDLHRPFIDEVVLPCECGGTMKRVKEVMDVWFDSGAMPFAQDHYPFEKTDSANSGLLFMMLKKIFGVKPKLAYPADFICEAIDQTRGWFYTLHAVGALMGKGRAYNNVISLGHILDAEGKKMSKSLGNVISPWDMMDLYGADALRFWMYSVNQPGDSKNFDPKTVDEVIKKVFNLALNVLSFYKMYVGEVGDMRSWSNVVSTNPLDVWIRTRTNELVATVTKHLDAYVFLDATRAVREYIGDLSQWYLRRSRDRFKDGGVAQKEAMATLRSVLLDLSKVMAPFTPFFAEHIYAEIGGVLESVHLESWPQIHTVEAKILGDMEHVRTISSRGLEARMTLKINVRQPLGMLKVKNSIVKTLSPSLIEIIKDEVNVKEVVGDETISTDVVLDATITPELKQEGDLRELLRKIQDARKEKNLTIQDTAKLTVTPDLAPLVEIFRDKIQKATKLSEITIGDSFELRR